MSARSLLEILFVGFVDTRHPVFVYTKLLNKWLKTAISSYALRLMTLAVERVVRVITGPPTHSVGGRLVTVAGVCRRL